MPKAADEELNGAAAALLGLHARDSRPGPAPVAPPPLSKATAASTTTSRTDHRSSGSQSNGSPPFPSQVPPREAPASVVEQGTASNPYPLYARQAYAGQQEQYAEHYAARPVLSARQDFRAGCDGGAGVEAGWVQPPQARRRTEWTPRFGPPAVALDPRIVEPVAHVSTEAWQFPRHRLGIRTNHRPLSPSHHESPGDRLRHFPTFQQKLTAAGVEPHLHPVVDQYHQDYAPAAASAGTFPLNDYQQRQQQLYQYQQQQQGKQQQQQQRRRQHEQYEEQRVAVAPPRQQLQPQQPQPQDTQHQPPQQRQQPPQREVQPQKPSINNLWSLIPGTLERQSSARSANRGNGGREHDGRGAGFNSDRWYAPDVHSPLSDIARRHRARALARLRARRRALAEYALATGRPAPVKRDSSGTTNEADSGSDGENDGDGDRHRHRSKVFLVEGESGGGVGLPRAISGGLVRGVSGGVVRAVSGCSEFDGKGSGGGDGEDAAAGDSVSTGERSGSGAEGVSPAVAGAGANPTAAAATSRSGSAPEAAGGGGDGTSSSAAPTKNKVGDLFALMHSVTMSVSTGGAVGDGAADGEENLNRELGKPVKYRYRQEAARSRKRTRGRFVSEKAPAFVSITELMALRRAERERQAKGEATPVPVGAG